MRIIKKPIIQPRDPDPAEQTAVTDASRAASNAQIQPPINTKGSSNNDKKWNAARQLRRGQAAAPEQEPQRSNKRRKLSGDAGYNSDDEHVPRKPVVGLQDGQTYLVMDEATFEKELKQRRGFDIYRVAPDGNCLFRSVADQVYGDENMQDEVRRLCMDYMEQERDYFSQFVTEDIAEYIARKRQNATYGNHLELQAVSELFNRPIEIFAHQPEPLNLFHTTYDDQNPPIRLSYHNGNHYNSVRDPNNPTVGVGLGFPVYEPGIADKLQIESAIRESESAMVENELVAASIMQSDHDAATEAILQAETAESELEFAQKQIEDAIARESLNAALSDALRNLLPPK